MKLNKKKKIVILIVAIVIIAIISIAVYFTLNPSYKITEDTTYVAYDKRQGAILTNVYTAYIENYYSEENTLVIFWASWCHNCQDETEAITTLMSENPNRKIVVVSHDETKNDLENYLTKNELNWFVIYDPTRIIRRAIDPEANSIPNTYLLNSKGEVINHYSGKMEIEDLRKFIKGEHLI